MDSEIEVYSEGDNRIYLQKGMDLLNFKLNVKFLFGGSKEQMKSHFSTLSKNKLSRKLIFLFDFDAVKEYDYCKKIETENLISMIIPQNNENTKVKSGIENLFSENLFDDQFYNTKITERLDGGSVITKSLVKSRFLNHICNERNKKEDFINFKGIFDKIKLTSKAKKSTQREN